MTAIIHIIPILRDNYAYIIEGADKMCLIVDPGQVTPVQNFLLQSALTPVAIFNTHHHADHVAGNGELVESYGIPVIGPEAERHKIPAFTHGVRGGDIVSYIGLNFAVIDTPGHTLGHIVFYDAEHDNLFSGDTLFSLGCGRLIEGNAEQMFESLRLLASLPPQTNMYCGHEYTESNARFALDIDPENQALKKRMEDIRKLRLNNLPTLPVTLKSELDANPFLRAKDEKEFAGLRARKDVF